MVVGKMKKSARSVTLQRVALAAPVFLLLCFASTLPLSSYESRSSASSSVRDPVIPLVAAAGESPFEALLDALRSATAAAGDRKNVTFNDQAAKTWRHYNPCKARTQLEPRYAQRDPTWAPNPNWEMVLREYSALHRTCMNSVGNLTEFYLSGSASSCKFLIVEVGGVGVGNKVAVMASAMLYAMLTQRVVLVNGESLLPWTMCEPFPGSCWMLDQHFPLPGRGKRWQERWMGWEDPEWKSSKYFERAVDASKFGKHTPPVSRVKVDHSDPEKTRFFCDTEQAFLAKAPWLQFSGCLYFLPKLFAVPAFRPALEALFPDPSLTLTYLLRSLLLPRDDVWEQVKQHDQELFSGVDHRVGIQIRFLYGRRVYFQGASKRVNDHVKQCVTSNNLLPNPTSLETITTASRGATRVLVTSLHTALTEDLRHTYANHPTVNITQLTHRGQQAFSTDEDLQAMVEIMLLSFVDELLVTPLSTFGGLAQAYGAIKPWFVEVKLDGGSSCVKAQTLDLCYQMAKPKYHCPHEPGVDGKLIQSVVPYVRRCLPIEESLGLQLVSSE